MSDSYWGGGGWGRSGETRWGQVSPGTPSSDGRKDGLGRLLKWGPPAAVTPSLKEELGKENGEAGG